MWVERDKRGVKFVGVCTVVTALACACAPVSPLALTASHRETVVDLSSAVEKEETRRSYFGGKGFSLM